MKHLVVLGIILLPIVLSGQVSLIKTNETCEGRKDGTIEVIVEGIDGPFTYQWSNGFKGAKATGLAPGDYQVTVTVAGNCSDVKAAKIWPGPDIKVDISALLLDISPQPVRCGSKPTFTYLLTAIPSGGKAPYYCSWGESANGTSGTMGECTKTVTGEDIDETVVLIDSLGCIDSEAWSKRAVTKICASDPNDITGPEGFGEPNWMSVQDELNYTIRFENDPIFATSNASVVLVTVPIDDDVDPFSFRLSTMGFGNRFIEVSDNASYFQQRLDYTDELGFMLDVTAGLDLPNARFFWLLETIDPITGQPPTDPLAGFLPVNDTLTGSGEGFINFFCKPKSTTPTGEFIEKQASIIFDQNEAILTNTWSNKIDALPPVTLPGNMSDTFYTNEIPFQWSIEDDPGGCGIKYAEVSLSADIQSLESTGLFIDTLNTTLTLQWGTTYYYTISGIDNVKNQEDGLIDSFYIIPRRSITFNTPDDDVYCIGDTLSIDIVLESLSSVDLYISMDSGFTYESLATHVSTWPYPLLLDSSHMEAVLFIKAENTAEAIFEISDPFTVRYLPDIDASDPITGCENEILFVEATGANLYIWSPEEIIGDPLSRYSNVYADSSQYVYVLGTDVYGCTNIDSVYITVYPTSLDSINQPLCEGDSILIDGDWILEEGYYPVVYSDLNGCDSTLVTHIYFESPCIWPGGPHVYVDIDATGENNGTSWADAFTDLNDAVYVAGRYENVQEIWVAEGVYRPHPTRRDTSFILIDSIRIYGGFLGIENDRTERTSNAALVQISGDINVPDTLWDNSYHTLRIDSSCTDCRLDGLTITYGHADEPMNNQNVGAGVVNMGKAMCYNVTFERNFATEDGAALHSSGASAQLILENCLFRFNTSNMGRDLVNLNGAQVEFRGGNMILQ